MAIFRQLFLLFFIISSVYCSPQKADAKLTFLSDKAADTFFEDFVKNYAAQDFIAWVKISTNSSEGLDGIVLQKSGNFILEFRSNVGESKKFFLSSTGQIWSNCGKSLSADKSFVDGHLYTPNDLLLPVICKSDAQYYGPKRVCGRATQQFIAPIFSQDAAVAFARFSVDSSFHQILQIEYLDKNKRLLRYQKLASLKKEGSDWVPKTLELFDVRSRVKTKVTIIYFEADLTLNSDYFSEDFVSKHTFLD